MLPSLLLSLGLIATCVLIHFEALRHMNETLPRVSLVNERQKVLIAIFGALGSHLVQIAFFALAFYVLHHTLGLGLIGGRFDDTFATYLYFSAETYTSLGFGDIYPAGEIRILAGVEALTGLLMISWSASFSYLEMRRFW
jgi:uncharacterized protein YhhL (DUF1145 family)